MRNRTVRFSDDDKKNHTRPVNPFERISSYEYVELVCSTCKKRINGVNMMEVEWVMGNNGQSFDRVHFYRDKEMKALEFAVRNHECIAKRISEEEMLSTPPIKELCSGFGVFPDGRKCPGCRDCRESIELQEDVAALLNIMDNQTFPDEIEIRPAPTAEDIFKIGMWVINTDNGHTYRLDTPSILAIVVEHYNNGNRNIKPYI